MSDSGEKTEEPTGKKIADARRRGQVARSREAGTFFVLMSGIISLWIFSGMLANAMRKVMQSCFSLTRDQVYTFDEMAHLFVASLMTIAPPILIIIVIILAVSVAGNLYVGGYNFSTEAIRPKFSKLNPISGIKRLFSVNSLIELVKSIGKITIISAFCYFMIAGRAQEIFNLSYIDPHAAIKQAIHLIFLFMLIVICGMIPIVLIDIPWQKFHYRKQLRMTKQEVKDEYKNAEGNPQIKSKIRHLQYEMAARRMMAKVPEADVVVTNPTHYAVALQYDPNGDTAPILVAKGVDDVAEIIKHIARECNVPVVPVPPLARSLYYTTELDSQIPRGLFKAVAQVLAWV
ncbi:MAG: flagellar biosynthesis protein FlhB, partial [Succinivibrio sp.]|nr:flagellar biosynthesis protein FlhB [Succinivibrio sp.]